MTKGLNLSHLNPQCKIITKIEIMEFENQISQVIDHLVYQREVIKYDT